MRPPTITINERILLRPWRKSDAQRAAELGDDLEIADNVGPDFPHPYTHEKAIGWVEHCEKIYTDEDDKTHLWCIQIDGEVAGGIGLEKFKNDGCMIGYWLGRPYWGQGHMTQIARTVTEYAMKNLGLVRVWAGVYHYNPGSARVLEKLGFEKEGHFRKAVKKRDGTYHDEWLYAKVR